MKACSFTMMNKNDLASWLINLSVYLGVVITISFSQQPLADEAFQAPYFQSASSDVMDNNDYLKTSSEDDAEDNEWAAGSYDDEPVEDDDDPYEQLDYEEEEYGTEFSDEE